MCVCHTGSGQLFYWSSIALVSTEHLSEMFNSVEASLCISAGMCTLFELCSCLAHLQAPTVSSSWAPSPRTTPPATSMASSPVTTVRFYTILRPPFLRITA